jgi:hypothetical protein
VRAFVVCAWVHAGEILLKIRLICYCASWCTNSVVLGRQFVECQSQIESLQMEIDALERGNDEHDDNNDDLDSFSTDSPEIKPRNTLSITADQICLDLEDVMKSQPPISNLAFNQV